jgi:hypothetical protein
MNILVIYAHLLLVVLCICTPLTHQALTSVKTKVSRFPFNSVLQSNWYFVDAHRVTNDSDASVSFKFDFDRELARNLTVALYGTSNWDLLQQSLVANDDMPCESVTSNNFTSAKFDLYNHPTMTIQLRTRSKPRFWYIVLGACTRDASQYLPSPRILELEVTWRETRLVPDPPVTTPTNVVSRFLFSSSLKKGWYYVNSFRFKGSGIIGSIAYKFDLQRFDREMVRNLTFALYSPDNWDRLQQSLVASDYNMPCESVISNNFTSDQIDLYNRPMSSITINARSTSSYWYVLLGACNRDPCRFALSPRDLELEITGKQLQ